jgi:hypothetical protein
MQQVNNIREIFSEYFKTNHPKLIIELGYGTGEFTNMIYSLRSEYPEPFRMITFDNKIYSGEVSANIIFCRADIFNSLPFIGTLIQENTLILCDNGNKVAEARRLIPHMLPGCGIMAHDYGEQDFWDYREIYDKDINDLVEKYGLYHYMQELLIKGAWLSLKK